MPRCRTSVSSSNLPSPPPKPTQIPPKGNLTTVRPARRSWFSVSAKIIANFSVKAKSALPNLTSAPRSSVSLSGSTFSSSNDTKKNTSFRRRKRRKRRDAAADRLIFGATTSKKITNRPSRRYRHVSPSLPAEYSSCEVTLGSSASSVEFNWNETASSVDDMIEQEACSSFSNTTTTPTTKTNTVFDDEAVGSGRSLPEVGEDSYHASEPTIVTRPQRRYPCCGNLSSNSNHQFVSPVEWQHEKQRLTEHNISVQTQRHALRTLRSTCRSLDRPFRRSFWSLDQATNDQTMFTVIAECSEEGDDETEGQCKEVVGIAEEQGSSSEPLDEATKAVAGDYSIPTVVDCDNLVLNDRYARLILTKHFQHQSNHKDSNDDTSRLQSCMDILRDVSAYKTEDSEDRETGEDLADDHRDDDSTLTTSSTCCLTVDTMEDEEEDCGWESNSITSHDTNSANPEASTQIEMLSKLDVSDKKKQLEPFGAVKHARRRSRRAERGNLEMTSSALLVLSKYEHLQPGKAKHNRIDSFDLLRTAPALIVASTKPSSSLTMTSDGGGKVPFGMENHT